MTSRPPKGEGKEITEREICQVMSQDLGMSYRKVNGISLNANIERSLVLRQRFALEMLKLLEQKKVVLNVDETWLGMSDFRRMKWRVKGTTNSVP